MFSLTHVVRFGPVFINFISVVIYFYKLLSSWHSFSLSLKSFMMFLYCFFWEIFNINPAALRVVCPFVYFWGSYWFPHFLCFLFFCCPSWPFRSVGILITVGSICAPMGLQSLMFCWNFLGCISPRLLRHSDTTVHLLAEGSSLTSLLQDGLGRCTLKATAGASSGFGSCAQDSSGFGWSRIRTLLLFGFWSWLCPTQGKCLSLLQGQSIPPGHSGHRPFECDRLCSHCPHPSPHTSWSTHQLVPPQWLISQWHALYSHTVPGWVFLGFS